MKKKGRGGKGGSSARCDEWAINDTDQTNRKNLKPNFGRVSTENKRHRAKCQSHYCGTRY